MSKKDFQKKKEEYDWNQWIEDKGDFHVHTQELGKLKNYIGLLQKFYIGDENNNYKKYSMN